MKRRNLIISLVAIVVIAVAGVLATIVTDSKPQLGLDLQGGASVTLPPVGKASNIALVGQTGKVLFRPVLSETSVEAAAAAASTSTTAPSAGSTTTAASTSTTTAAGSSTTAAGGSSTTTLPPGAADKVTPRAEDKPGNTVVLPGRDGKVLYQMGPAFALGEEAISTAGAQVNNGAWVVALKLKEGAKGLDA